MAAETNLSAFGYARDSRVLKIPGVVYVNDGSAGKPKGGDPRADQAPLTVDAGKSVHTEIRRVPHDVASMAATIRVAEGLPDHFATNFETGGAS